MRERVDGDGDGEDQHGLALVEHVDAVRVPHAEPLLGDLGDLVAVTLHLVFVIDDVPVHLDVIATVDLDVESVTNPTNAFFTVADRPPCRSILILSRTLSFFSWISATVFRPASSSFQVSRIRAALPLTL